MKPVQVLTTEPVQIAIEDLATIFASEFVKMHSRKLQRVVKDNEYRVDMPFLKMPYAKRRKLVEQTLDKIHDKYWNQPNID